MKILIVADLHGNSFALRQVLHAVRNERIDRTCCLGDIAALGPDPAGTVALARQRFDVTIRGNTDEWLTTRLRHAEIVDETGPLLNLATWAYDQLTAETLAWMETRPPSGTVELTGDQSLLLVHGTVDSSTGVITGSETVAELDRLTGGEATITAGGHTHLQSFRRFGSRAYLNPGSAGLPGAGPDNAQLRRNRDVAWVEFAIVTAEDGANSVDLRRLPLPMSDMRAWAATSGMPHLDGWLARWT